MTKHDAARKQKIIDFIAMTVRDRGYPPSVREIAVAVDLASTSAVHHHLQALEREGLSGTRREPFARTPADSSGHRAYAGLSPAAVTT